MKYDFRCRGFVKLALAAGATVLITVQTTFAADPAENANEAANDQAVAQTTDELLAVAYPDYVTPVGCDAAACGDAGCGDVACGDCCTTCCKPCWHCIAGTEATFLIPDVNGGDLEFNVLDETDGRDDTIENDGFELDDMEFAPRLWVGVERGCWGVVSRFWHLDACDSTGELYDTDDDDNIGYGLNNDLEMYTIDLEATRKFCHCDSTHVVSLGARYGYVEHNGLLGASAQTEDLNVDGFAEFRQSARGTGMTTSLSGTRPVRCGSCVKAFYAVRGSVLWGETNTLAQTQARAAGTIGGANVEADATNGAATNVTDEIWIGEAQVGLQMDYELKCSPANAFVRVAAEYQHWSADTGFSIAQSFAGGIDGNGDVQLGTADASTGGIEVDLVGFSVSTGLTW